MTNSHANLFIHAIWSTKGGAPIIHPEIEKNIHKYIRELFNTSGCYVIAINGMSDHVHVLFLQNSDIDLSVLMKLMKSGMTHYINSSGLVKERFSWQRGCCVYPVSISSLPRVRRYIKKQKEYHTRKNVKTEFEELMMDIEYDAKVPLNNG